MRRLVPLLLLGITLLAPAPAQDLEGAEASLRTALREDTLQPRLDALAEVQQVGGREALALLQELHVASLLGADEAAEALERLERDQVHKERVLRGMRLRFERDESLEDVVERLERELELLSVDVKRAQATAEVAGPWLTALEEAVRALHGQLDEVKGRAALKGAWTDARKHPDWTVRRAAVRLLGLTGGSGTAVDLHDLMEDLLSERAKLLKKLPKAEADAFELEGRMQAEADATGGRLSAATRDQYDRARAEASAMRTACVQQAKLADDCALSASRALERESESAQGKSIQALVRTLPRAKNGARLRTIGLLAGTNAPLARAQCRLVLAGEREPAAIAALLEALSRFGDPLIVPSLCETWLGHEAWVVRIAAARALAVLRAPEGVPAMIERLEEATGRERTDLAAALRELTGQRFRAAPELWRRWWADAEEGFQPAPPEAGDPMVEEAAEEGVTFFGIQTDSQRVLFVLDVSGSMNWSIVVRDNPYDDPGKQPDLPRSGEMSRLAAAKQDLQKAIAGLRDGAVFNLVLYASDVWTWQKGLVEMDSEQRDAVRGFIERTNAVGGTNLFGALRSAFELAGTRIGDDWREPPIDTIFVLTDGKPSVGTTIDPDEILSHVREWNRAAGITVHTIGLSGAQDAYLLERLAEENGGRYVAR